jgi:glycosyltransferase involved in cell wall biosynthesis
MTERCGISVVIPVYNGADTIGEQLRAVLDQSVNCEFEVIVADNGSTDRTREIAEGFARADARVRVIDASAIPRSGAGAKNLGVEAARSPLLAFCDADDLVAPGWLQETVDGLREAPVVHAALERWRFNPKLRGAVAEYSFGGDWGRVPVLSGGGFGIRRDLYLSIGGFDPHFPGTPDTEFGIRLYKSTRVRPREQPGAVIHVRLPDSTSATFRRSRALGQTNRLLAARHHDVIERRSIRIVLASLLWILRHVPDAVRGRGRLMWIRRTANTLGEIESYVRPSLARRIRAERRMEPTVKKTKTVLMFAQDLRGEGGLEQSSIANARIISEGRTVDLIYGGGGRLLEDWERCCRRTLSLGSLRLRRREPARLVLQIARSIAFCASQSPDVIYCQSMYELPLARVLARTLRRPLVMHLRHAPSVVSKKNVRRLGAVDRAIAASESAAHDWISAFPSLQGKTRVIPNGVDLHRFVPVSADEKLTLRSRLDIPADALVVGYLGRFSPEKGPLDAIEAVRRIGRPNVHLLLAGSAAECGEYGKRVLNAGTATTRILEFQPEIERIIQAVDLVVVPSYSETFGRIVIESLACGVPVLASRVGGIPEILRDLPGAMFEAGNIAELASKIEQRLVHEAEIDPESPLLRDIAARYDERSVALRIDSALMDWTDRREGQRTRVAKS